MKTGWVEGSRWFRGLSLRWKLIGGFTAMVVLTGIMGIVAAQSQVQLSAHVKKLFETDAQIAELTMRSDVIMVNARRNEKDFLLQLRELGFREAKARYLPLFQLHLSDIRNNMALIRELTDDPDVIRRTQEVEQAVGRYEAGFLNVVALLGKLGRVDTGIEGDFRNKVHEAEAIIREHNQEKLLVDLLTIRRNEKDFLLRSIEKEATRARQAVEKLKVDGALADLPPEVRDKLTLLVNEYVALFDQYVAVEAEIVEKTEFYRTQAHTVEPILEQLRISALSGEAVTRSFVQHAAQRTIWTVSGGGVGAIIVVLLIAFGVSRTVTHGIRANAAFAHRLAQGDLDARMAVVGNDEFAWLSTALNDMAAALQHAHLDKEQREAELRESNRWLREEIGDRERAEEKLLQAKQDWENTFNSITDMITIHDKDFNIVRYNKIAEKILRMSGPEILHAIKCYASYHGKDCPPEECPSCRALLTGEEVIAEVFEPHLNMFLEIRAVPRLGADNQVAGLVHVVRDITERKRAEEETGKLESQLRQSQKMEAIGTLAGGIAHDFNNLLQVVLGYSEILLSERREDDPEYADLLKIRDSARSGAELVQGLLMFSRKTEPKSIPLNLNRQIGQVQKLLKRLIPKMIQIDLDLAENLSDTSADPTQMEQVLMNLAVNAGHAMPDGGTLTVATRNVTLDEEYCKLHVGAKPGDYVQLTVSDTGHGMDKATSERIFEPFFTTKELGLGTGLGLAMVYGIVKQHNGHISCYSEVGRGTVFKVYLPAIESRIARAEEEAGLLPAYGTETLLLVDDEASVRELALRILSRAGYTVLSAANCREAIDLFTNEHERISLVILDLIMPEVGGKACLGKLLNIHPQVKVLVASGYSADSSAKECLEMGAKDFINKPFRMMELLRAVRNVLDDATALSKM